MWLLGDTFRQLVLWSNVGGSCVSGRRLSDGKIFNLIRVDFVGCELCNWLHCRVHTIHDCFSGNSMLSEAIILSVTSVGK